MSKRELRLRECVGSALQKARSAFWAWITRSGAAEWTMVFVTLGVLWYAKVQSGVTIEQARISDRQTLLMAAEQRPWVGPTADSPKGETIEPGKPIAISVTLNNTGQTPALYVETTGGSKVVQRGESFDPYSYSFPEPFSRAVILPGDSIRMPFANAERRKATSEDIRSIAKGQLVVYLVGKITYLDAFRTEHHTRFCRVLVPESEITDKATGITRVTWYWTVTPTGNDMD